jgi:hypothetical protein
MIQQKRQKALRDKETYGAVTNLPTSTSTIDIYRGVDPGVAFIPHVSNLPFPRPSLLIHIRTSHKVSRKVTSYQVGFHMLETVPGFTIWWRPGRTRNSGQSEITPIGNNFSAQLGVGKGCFNRFLVDRITLEVILVGPICQPCPHGGLPREQDEGLSMFGC